MTSTLQHDPPHPLTGDQRKTFVDYLAKVFRMPPAAIERLANCQETVNGIWHSLKGLTGVTAKCMPTGTTSGCPAQGKHGIKMGGIVILAAAHCPEAGKWLKDSGLPKAPGNPLLSLDVCCEMEIQLWEKLNAFGEKIIPCISDPHISNISSVTLSPNSVAIKLIMESFEPKKFSDRLTQNNGGGACTAFRDLQDFLAEGFSKTSLEWNQNDCVFTFTTKSNKEKNLWTSS